jgi:hypothetical protein
VLSADWRGVDFGREASRGNAGRATPPPAAPAGHTGLSEVEAWVAASAVPGAIATEAATLPRGQL